MAVIHISDPLNDFTSDDGEDGTREYETFHLVTVSDPSDSGAVIYASSLIPRPHVTVAPWDSAVTCRSRRLEYNEDAYTWGLTVRWSSKQQFEKPEDNPLIRPVKGAVRFVDKERPAFIDSEGRPLVNTAGDLYAGLTVVDSIAQVSVTALFQNWPFFLWRFNNTVNQQPARMFGIWFPARTCWMNNLYIPDEPADENGVKYWPVTYDINVDAAGYYDIYPNSGLNRIQYQVRDNASAPWEDVPFSEYAAKTPPTDRRKQRRRCLDGVGNDSGETWLDEHGQETLPTFTNGSVGTAAASAGTDIITLSVNTFTPDSVGLVITLKWPEPFNQSIQLQVVEVISETEARVHLTANASFSGVPASVSGAAFNVYKKQRGADWSTLPLPPIQEP